MDVLVLSKKFPYPLKDGESIAIDVLSNSMRNQGINLDMLAMNTSKHHADPKKLDLNNTPYKSLHSVEVNIDLNIKDALLNLFSSDSYHISRFVSKEYEKKLISLLKSKPYDIVQLETLYLTPYIDTIRKYSKAKIVLRAHNVEHEIWERIVSNTTNPIKKIYLQYLVNKLKSYELANIKKIDLLLPISQLDAKKFRSLGYKGTCLSLPIGIKNKSSLDIDTSNYTKPYNIGFIGSLDWIPNQEGLVWFMDNVWTKFHKKNPKHQLHIAGRNTPEWIKNSNWPSTTIHGEVPSAEAFTTNNQIMVIPLLSGSGMRAKILEALSLGRNIVTTSVGVEGIDAQDLEAVYVADNAEDFTQHLENLVQQNGELKRNGQKAKSLILERYDSDLIGKRLSDKYRLMIGTPENVSG